MNERRDWESRCISGIMETRGLVGRTCSKPLLVCLCDLLGGEQSHCPVMRTKLNHYCRRPCVFKLSGVGFEAIQLLPKIVIFPINGVFDSPYTKLTRAYLPNLIRHAAQADRVTAWYDQRDFKVRDVAHVSFFLMLSNLQTRAVAHGSHCQGRALYHHPSSDGVRQAEGVPSKSFRACIGQRSSGMA